MDAGFSSDVSLVTLSLSTLMHTSLYRVLGRDGGGRAGGGEGKKKFFSLVFLACCISKLCSVFQEEFFFCQFGRSDGQFSRDLMKPEVTYEEFFHLFVFHFSQWRILKAFRNYYKRIKRRNLIERVVLEMVSVQVAHCDVQ